MLDHLWLAQQIDQDASMLLQIVILAINAAQTILLALINNNGKIKKRRRRIRSK